MLEELRTIPNPIVRMIVAATAVGSIVTLGAAAAIGIAQPQSPYKSAVSAGLIATGSGALLGLISGKAQPASRLEVPKPKPDQPWQDWRNFVVVRKVQESAEITSFYLQPQDGGTIPSFQPGQFLTIQLNIPGQPRPIIRTYSLSDYSSDHYRLSIKREPAPKGLAVSPGIASNFLHDAIQEGAIIPAKPPSGKFVIEPHTNRPAVLISNGVGITPMISMAKACSALNPDRPIWFVHGARDGESHAFRAEVLAIAQQNPNLRVHFCYSQPRAEDADRYHSQGYVDADLVQQLTSRLDSPFGSEAEYFLCGSPPFLQSLREGLQSLGVPDSCVFYESFGGGKAAIKHKSVTRSINGQENTTEITFAQSEQTLTWQPNDGTILEFAEANGLEPAYSCRQGICLTCMCKLKAGEVEYETPPIGTPDPGSVLICIAKPKTAIVLDL